MTLRRVWIYVLVPFVAAAAASLAYYGYSYSAKVSERERQLLARTMLELAREKVIAIQTAIMESDQALAEVLAAEGVSQLPGFLEKNPRPNVLVLDPSHEIVPGGRHGDESFAELFRRQIMADLDLDSVPLHELRYLHRTYDGRPLLIGYQKVFGQGALFYVVAEVDLGYVLAEVFSQVLDIRSAYLYQVVGVDGGLIYGYAFTGVPESAVIELGFPATLSGWRLRVAPRVADALVSSGLRQQTLDLVLIGLAVAIIVAGLVTLLVAVRRERRLSQLKSDFISNVSHELKTPLSLISMFGELLAMGRTRSAEQATEYAEIIRRESVRLSRLIDNVLDFAKIERGVEVYEFADSEDFGAVVTRAVDLCRHRLDRADMVAETEIDPDTPPVRLDENAMTLAILNLLDNAIKYAPEGEKLEIHLGPVDGRVELYVRDYGPGISPDERDEIFERFYRSRSARLKPVRGSGIGLALVKHIAEAHGGGVDVDTTLDKGCAFRLWIPAPKRG